MLTQRIVRSGLSFLHLLNIHYVMIWTTFIEHFDYFVTGTDPAGKRTEKKREE